MLQNSLEKIPEGATFANVVSDYHQCYRKSDNSNVEALYQALFVATNNGILLICFITYVIIILDCRLHEYYSTSDRKGDFFRSGYKPTRGTGTEK